MKKLRIVLLTLQLLCTSSPIITPGATRKTSATEQLDQSFTLDVLTVYNPVVSQCDASPLITASNQRINQSNLRSGAFRWMALSRDLLNRWGGALHYGDTVSLHSGDSTIDGSWVIQDTMNKRFRNRGDLLFDAGTRSGGKWSDVIITKRKKRALKMVQVDDLLTGRP